jgi:hypothetical protein
MSIGGILGDRRRPGLDPLLVGRVFLVWAVVCVLQLATNSMAIWETRFPDPDDTMRLVQVRDWIGGQGWFDLRQHRADAYGGGVAMNWSRLVDLPLAAVIVALAPLLGQAAAETAAMTLIPLLTMGCVFILVGRIAWKIFDEEIAGLACLACAVAVPLLHQIRPMRIDHHGWEIVLMLVALNGLMARDARRGGWAIGGALAVWLSLSLEGLPFAASFVALTAFKWLRNRADRWWMVHTLHALVAVSGALFLVTRGLGDLAEHCDAISPVHLAIFAWGAAVTTINAMLEPHPRAFTFVGMAITVAGAVILAGQIAPQCGPGGSAELDPLVRAFWYDHLLEAQPVWKDSVVVALMSLALPLFGLVAALRLAGMSSDWLRRWWIDYALLLAAAIVVTLFVAGAGSIAAAIAAVPMGYQLREWTRATRNLREPRRRIAALAAVVLALAPALPATLFVLAAPGKAVASETLRSSASSCPIDAVAGGLRRLPKGDILAPLDISPRLLYATGHTVVATGNRRAAGAIHDVVQTFVGSERTAHAVVARRGIDYVALCPGLSEARRYAAAAPTGLAAQLGDGRAPPWLRPVAVPGSGGFRLWKVVG